MINVCGIACTPSALATRLLVSLATAAYAAGMAVVQREARRFFAYLFLSHASLILVGLELHTTVSLTGALALLGGPSRLRVVEKAGHELRGLPSGAVASEFLDFVSG